MFDDRIASGWARKEALGSDLKPPGLYGLLRRQRPFLHTARRTRRWQKYHGPGRDSRFSPRSQPAAHASSSCRDSFAPRIATLSNFVHILAVMQHSQVWPLTSICSVLGRTGSRGGVTQGKTI